MPPKPPKNKTSVKNDPNQDEPPNTPFPTPSLSNRDLRMSYAIARGEQGVLTFEPYKSILLPHWRFRTVAIATQSSATLWAAFEQYVAAGDFVGADMARKFIQMGMTRAKRYANHAGGRKYDRTARQVEESGGTRTELPKSTGHKGQEEKLAASEVFKDVWRNCTSHEGYLQLKAEWQKEKKDWEKGGRRVKKESDNDDDNNHDKKEVEMKREASDDSDAM